MAPSEGEKNRKKENLRTEGRISESGRKKEIICVLMICLQDLAQYVNEVKRDNETMREIDQYQKSIENLVSHLFHPNN